MARPPQCERVAALRRRVILDASPARLCFGFPRRTEILVTPSLRVVTSVHMETRACVGQSRPTEYFLVASHGFTSGRMSSSAGSPVRQEKTSVTCQQEALPLGFRRKEKRGPGFTIPFMIFTINCVSAMVTAKWTLPCCPALGAFIHAWSCAATTTPRERTVHLHTSASSSPGPGLSPSHLWTF